jgi:hypothetical protein
MFLAIFSSGRGVSIFPTNLGKIHFALRFVLQNFGGFHF